MSSNDYLMFLQKMDGFVSFSMDDFGQQGIIDGVNSGCKVFAWDEPFNRNSDESSLITLVPFGDILEYKREFCRWIKDRDKRSSIYLEDESFTDILSSIL